MNELDVIKYFINKGLSPEAAMGMTGYFLGESSLNPDSVNKYSGAYGIGQWIGPRKKALFDAYGNKPTMQQQLDFAWNELNSTHKGALEQLKTLNDPQLASDMMYGGFGFGFGKLKPEKAAVAANKEMAKWGQNGEASRAIKRKHANRLYNTYGSIFNVNTDYNPQEYQVAQKYNPSINTPSLKIKQVNKTLPEIEIKGTRRRQPTEQSLNVPSLKSMTAQKMNYDMLKMAGMINDEDDAFLNYMMQQRLNRPYFT